MHVLMINIPSRKGPGGKFIPLGLLYLGSIIERCGCTCELIDPYLEDPYLKGFDNGDYNHIDRAIQTNKPDVVAFGGIASSYGRTKKLSQYLFDKHPGIMQVAGGPLASVYKLLLTKTYVNLVFHGEAEISFTEFLHGKAVRDIKGVSYRSNGEAKRNEPADQIENLDVLPYPAYHLVNVKGYLENGKLAIMSSRGCTNKCSFCYRHMKGHRQHSVDYFVNHIKFIIAKYGISQFLIADEFFNANSNWILDFCDKIYQLKIQYGVAGARINNISLPMLIRLQQTGCEFIYYGQESGSPTILKEYRKGITVAENIEGTKLTMNVGIKNIVQLVIGTPSETQDTINETIRFLKEIGTPEISVNYLIPFPETPIWNYVEENNLVPDVEKYLDEVADRGGVQILNLTKVPDNIWRTWSYQIQGELYGSLTAKIILPVYRILG